MWTCEGGEGYWGEVGAEGVPGAAVRAKMMDWLCGRDAGSWQVRLGGQMGMRAMHGVWCRRGCDGGGCVLSEGIRPRLVVRG